MGRNMRFRLVTAALGSAVVALACVGSASAAPGHGDGASLAPSPAVRPAAVNSAAIKAVNQSQLDSIFQPIQACRIMDTTNKGGSLKANKVRHVRVRGTGSLASQGGGRARSTRRSAPC
jgi:hypothetical protein